jgi:hypothetical protein
MMPDAANASLFTTCAFIVLPSAVLVLVLLVLGRAHKRPPTAIALAFAGWLTLTGLLAGSGRFADFTARPPLLPLVVVGAMIGAVGFARSRYGRAIIDYVPLIVFHTFRFVLELAMNQASNEQVMPRAMSFHGYNFDIITGVTALLLAVALHRNWAPRWVVLAWNIMGLVFLVIVAGVAIATTPLFEALGPSQRNTWIAHAPFIWLPTVLVPAALAGHLMIFAKLRAPQPSQALHSST